MKKGGSSATWVIANGAFPFLGCDPGKDFGTRVDPGRPELKCKVFINCKLRTEFKMIKIQKKILMKRVCELNDITK